MGTLWGGWVELATTVTTTTTGFCEVIPTAEGCEVLFLWWVSMLVLAVGGTATLFGYTWMVIAPPDAYGLAMKWLAVPWVVESMWRTVFPSLYLQRFVFFNTPLNAILTDRCFAFVGEMGWVSQTALALSHIDRECTASGKGRPLIQLSAILAVVVYALAEGISFYNMATTNEWWAAAEVFVDAVGYVVMAPSALYLIATQDLGGKTSSGTLFCGILAVFCVVYPLYNFFLDVPLYMKRYHADQAAGKTYFPFWAGVEDAATRKTVTHRLQDWEQDLGWMTMYFTVGCWSAILLMWAPRVRPHPSTRGKAALIRLDTKW